MKVLSRTLIVFLLAGILSGALAADPNVFKKGNLSGWEKRESSTVLRVAKDAERAEVLAIDYSFESLTYAWWRYWFRPSLDATNYKGLSFWVKGDGSGRSLSPILSFWPGNVELKYSAPAIPLTFEGWRQFKVYFNEFKLNGRPVTDQELARLDNIMFTISGRSGEKGTIHMDGLEFFGKRSINEQSGMVVTEQEPAQIELLSALDSQAGWSGSPLTIVEDESRGKVGSWKLSARGEQLRFIPANKDWSQYTGLGLWIRGAGAADVQFELVLSADGPAAGWDYYHIPVVVDWDGWQLLLVPFSVLKKTGTPLDLARVDYLLLSTRGWGLKPAEGTLLIDKVFLYQDSSSQPQEQAQTATLPSRELPEIPRASGGLVVDTFENTRRWGDKQVTTIQIGDNRALVWELLPQTANFLGGNISDLGIELIDFEQCEFDYLVESKQFASFYFKAIDYPLADGWQAVWKIADPGNVEPYQWYHATFDLHKPEDRWGERPDLTSQKFEFRVNSTATEPIRIYIANLRLTKKLAEAEIVGREVKEEQGTVRYTYKIGIENRDQVPWIYYVSEREPAQELEFSLSISPEQVFVNPGATGEILLILELPASRREHLDPLYNETRTIVVEGMQGDEMVQFQFRLGAGNMLPAKQHPHLFFTAEDIEAILQKLASFPEAKAQYEALIRNADNWLSRPIDIPDRGGQWGHWYSCPTDGVRLQTLSPTQHRCPVCGTVYTGEPYDSVLLTNQHNTLANAARDLGLAYSFSGNSDYALKAKEILLGYAEKYLQYELHDINGKQTKSGARVTSQTLEEAVWLIPIAWSYDMIYNTLTEAERESIENKLLRPAVEVIQRNDTGMSNWQSWHNAAIAAAGFVLRDAGMVYEAIRGGSGFEFQMENSVLDDGFWYEGAWGYHFYALDALIYLAEMAYQNGINVYSERFKKMFDAPLLFMTSNFSVPAFNDSGTVALLGQVPKYEIAYARYKDPKYLQLLTRGNRANWQALLYGSPIPAEAEVQPLFSTVFPTSGYAILRVGDHYAALDYGPHGGWHGHYDKLGFINYKYGVIWGVDPGSINYGVPLQDSWFKRTVSHNTVVVNQKTQQETTGELLRFFESPLFALAQAAADGANKDTSFSRLLAMTNRYLLFFDSLKGKETQQYDWVYHSYGQLTAAAQLQQASGALGSGDGYQHIQVSQRGIVTDMIDATWLQGDKGIRLLMSPARSELILGKGPGNPPDRDCPLVMVRRNAQDTHYAGILEPFVENSTVFGVEEVEVITEAGQTAMGLEIRHEKGTDLFVYAHDQGMKTVSDWQTDAQIFFAENNGDLFQVAFLDGKVLCAENVKLKLDRRSDFYLARLAENQYLIGNKGKERVQLTASLPFTDKGAELYLLDADFRRKGKMTISAGGESQLLMELEAGSYYELAAGGAEDVAELIAKLLAAEPEFEYKVRELPGDLLEKADRPKGVRIVVQGEDFVAEGGGQVEIITRVATDGQTFRMWDNPGHWLEWEFEVPQTGLYKIGFRYCTQVEGIERNLIIDEEYPVPEAMAIKFPNTYGWSSVTDDWEELIFSDEEGKPVPIYLEEGKHKLRMYNLSGGGLNIDYLYILSLDE